MSYADFLTGKLVDAPALGFTPHALPAELKDFQVDLVIWALERGRAALFAERGLGKAFMELSWAQRVAFHTHRKALILAPLAVSWQLAREAERFAIEAAVWDGGDRLSDAPVVITNYEKLERLIELDLIGCSPCMRG